MAKDLTYSILFMLAAIWFVFDEWRHWNNESVQRLGGPFRKHVVIFVAIVLFVVGLLYLLDTLKLLRQDS